MVIWKRRGQKGDTIVEVLLAVVVISAILGAAFVTLRDGQQDTRASQERAEALKQVETQIEYLKSLTADATTFQTITSDTDVCLQNNSGTISIVEFDQKVPEATSDDFSVYPAQCRVGDIPGSYNLSMSEGNGDDENVFTVRARWERVNGEGIEQLEIKYRVFS